jgi:hypothetical protein
MGLFSRRDRSPSRDATTGPASRYDPSLDHGSIDDLDNMPSRLVASWFREDPGGPRWLESGWRHARALFDTAGVAMPIVRYARVGDDAIDLHVVPGPDVVPLGPWHSYVEEPGWWVLDRGEIVAEELSTAGMGFAQVPLFVPVGLDDAGVAIWVNLEHTGGLVLDVADAEQVAFELVSSLTLCPFLADTGVVLVGLGAAGWPADLAVGGPKALERATRFGSVLGAHRRRCLVVTTSTIPPEVLERLRAGGVEVLVIAVGAGGWSMPVLDRSGVLRGCGADWSLGVVGAATRR